MAGRERPPNKQTDPDHPSPAAKKSKRSGSRKNSRSSSAASTESDINLLLCSESERLPTSSDESFGDANEEKGNNKSSVGEGTSASTLPARATPARAGPSTGTLASATPARARPLTGVLGTPTAAANLVTMKRSEGGQSLLKGEHGYYRNLSVIGNGAYGTVYKANNAASGQVVALKKLHVIVTEDGLPISTLREIATLRQIEKFNNPLIIRLLDVCQGNYLTFDSTDDESEGLNRDLTLWLVFEHVDRDLAKFMATCKSYKISPTLIKRMSKEILAGVDFLHSHRIVHRDLKPQNLLVTQDCHIKIADFGLAKTYDFHMRLTSVVVTLWYRAPEILMGCPYATPIDVWSVGCILAELNDRKPLFPGDTEVNQLDKIFSIIGLPPGREWPEHTSLSYTRFALKHVLRSQMEIPHLDDSRLDLIHNMLIFNPHKRLTAAQALKHRYFTE